MNEPTGKLLSLVDPQVEPVEDVVVVLSHLLAEAKAGRIRALAYACLSKNEDGPSRFWAACLEEPYQTTEMIGALCMLRSSLEYDVHEMAKITDISSDEEDDSEEDD